MLGPQVARRGDEVSEPSSCATQISRSDTAHSGLPHALPGPASCRLRSTVHDAVHPATAAHRRRRRRRSGRERHSVITQNDIMLMRGNACPRRPRGAQEELPKPANGAVVSTKNNHDVPSSSSAQVVLGVVTPRRPGRRELPQPRHGRFRPNRDEPHDPGQQHPSHRNERQVEYWRPIHLVIALKPWRPQEALRRRVGCHDAVRHAAPPCL